MKNSIEKNFNLFSEYLCLLLSSYFLCVSQLFSLNGTVCIVCVALCTLQFSSHIKTCVHGLFICSKVFKFFSAQMLSSIESIFSFTYFCIN